MDYLKQHRVFFILLGILLLGGLGGLIFSMQAASKTESLAKKYQASVNRYQSLVSLDPAPTLENLDRMERDLEGLNEQFLRYEKNFSPAEPLSTSSDAVEVLPKIQGLIVEYRRAFASQGTKFNEEEAFGFARYQEEVEPPNASIVPLLDKQIQILVYLLDLLLASEPASILSIEREFVERGDPNQVGVPTNADPREDLFIMDRQASARVPDLVNTLAFRLRFTGYTDTLRQFLNGLSRFDLPVIVRGVEVAQVSSSQTESNGRRTNQATSTFAQLFGSAEETSGPEEAASEDGQKPIIENNESEFVVILEFIELELASLTETMPEPFPDENESES